MNRTIRRALVSVSDKACLEELGRGLAGLGIEILATGGTAERLKRAGVAFRPVEEFSGNPEAFDGRMKTISFKIESAILFDRASDAHVEQAARLGIEPIDLVVCNFYPFEETLARGARDEDLIHEIDIGGPTMVRAAAKNFQSVLVLTDPADYASALAELKRLGGRTSLETHRRMMVKAFERVLAYDQAIYEGFARRPLRYGENPHQAGWFVPYAPSGPAGMEWELVEGAGLELSYNNILDAQAALGAARDARAAAAAPGHGACAIVKHNNPCGLATAPTVELAFRRAWAGDPVSAFGGVVVFSSPLTVECARLFEEKFVEVVLAPGFEDGAVQELRRKKKKLRVLRVGRIETPHAQPRDFQRVRVDGGYLVQSPDEGSREDFKTVTRAPFPDELRPAACLAVVAAKWIKSNAIALAQALPDGGLQLIGMGSGQPNRVDAIRRLAVPKALEALARETQSGAGTTLDRCVLASDAFFPFADSIVEARAAGIRYVIQPGGSIRDAEVIAECDRLGLAMAFTGRRHFRH